MEKRIGLFKMVNGVEQPFPNADNHIEIGEFRYEATRMGGAPIIEASIMHRDFLDGQWSYDVYAKFNGEKYYLTQIPTSSFSNEDDRYKYELSLASERTILDNVYFYDAVIGEVPIDDKPISNSTNVVFSGTIHEFVDRLNASLEYSGLYDSTTGEGYHAVVDGDIDNTDIQKMSFDNQFFSNVLQEIYNTYELPYYFVGKTIHIGYGNSEISSPFRYGVDNELLAISKQNANYKVVNRTTATGSTDNIPYYYPNPTPKGYLGAVSSNNNVTVNIINPLRYNDNIDLDGVIVYHDEDLPLPDNTEVFNVVDRDYFNNYVNNNGSVHHVIAKSTNPHRFRLTIDTNPEDTTIHGWYRFRYVRVRVLDSQYRITSSFEMYAGGTGDRAGMTYNEGRPSISDRVVPPPSSVWTMVGDGEVEFNLDLEEGDNIIKLEFSKFALDGMKGTIRWKLDVEDVIEYHGWSYGVRHIQLSDVGLSINGTPQNGDTITQTLIKRINTSTNLLPSIYRSTNGNERFYNATNEPYTVERAGEYSYTVDYGDIVFDNPYTAGKPKEHIFTAEDIKPTIKGSVYNNIPIDRFLEVAFDDNDNNEWVEDSDESEEEIKHSYFFIKLPALGFNLFDHAIEGKGMVIEMTSGQCSSCKFEIGVSEETQENIVQVDEDGNLLRNDKGEVIWRSSKPQEIQNDTTNHPVWIALKKDITTYGESQVMPDRAYFVPTTDDTFIITNILLPEAYIMQAEARLEEAIVDYLKENNAEKFNFSITFSRIYLEEHSEILDVLNENSKIKVDYNGTIFSLYVNSFSYVMSDGEPLPDISVELDDTLTVANNAPRNTVSSLNTDKLGGSRYYIQSIEQRDGKVNVGIAEFPTYAAGTRMGGPARSAMRLDSRNTIWGQEFNGTQSVAGDMSNIGDITPSNDATHDIGTPSKRFDNIHVVGVKASGTVEAEMGVSALGIADLQQGSSSSGGFVSVETVGSGNGVASITTNGGALVQNKAHFVEQVEDHRLITPTEIGKLAGLDAALDGKQSVTAAEEMRERLQGQIDTLRARDQFDELIATSLTVTDTIAGNAATADEFKSAKSVALTGDVTGSATSKGGWSVSTTIANNAVTNAKLANSSITLAGQSVSLGGSISKGTLLDKLNVADGAQVNVLEAVHLNGTTLAITNKAVNVNAVTKLNPPTGLTVSTLNANGEMTVSVTSGYMIPKNNKTFWGQTWNGTDNVKGTLSHVGDIQADGNTRTIGTDTNRFEVKARNVDASGGVSAKGLTDLSQGGAGGGYATIDTEGSGNAVTDVIPNGNGLLFKKELIFATEQWVNTGLNSKLNTSLKGANNGLAELDATGKVPSSQLPSYVDDVLEYSAKTSFPTTGETGKIYVDTTTNLTYRWSGTAYVEISKSLALGETSATAYRGDRGATAYDHSQKKGSGTVSSTNPHGLTPANIGASAVGHTHTKADVTDFPTSMPASDVYSWAKAASKPSYSWSEIGSKPTTLSGYGITDGITAVAVDTHVTRLQGQIDALRARDQFDELFADYLHVTGSVTSPTFVGALQGNADTATKLKTARTLWGQSFDGSGNVSGNMTGVGSLTASGNIEIIISSSQERSVRAKNSVADIMLCAATSGNRGIYDNVAGWLIGCNNTYTWLNRGNVAIGNITPTEKLHVDGGILANSNITASGNVIASGGVSAKGVIDLGIAGGGGGYASIELDQTENAGNAVTEIYTNGNSLVYKKSQTFSLQGHTHSQYLTANDINHLATTASLADYKPLATELADADVEDTTDIYTTHVSGYGSGKWYRRNATKLWTYIDAKVGTKYLGKSANAASASKLTVNAGSATQPIYFENGIPKATTYTLSKSVPSDAKFTDTVYTLPLATSSAKGGVKIGYSESGDNFAVKLSSEKAFVTVPLSTLSTNLQGQIDALRARDQFDELYSVYAHIDTLTATTLSIGTLTASGATTLNGVTTVSSTLTVSGVTTLNSTTDSTATSNGALVVKGGLGIAKQLRVAGAATLGSTLSVSGAVNITNSTAATSKTTGALKVAGGMGVGGSLYANALNSSTYISSGTYAKIGTYMIVGTPSLSQYASSRAEVSIVTSSNNPSDLWMGSNSARKWSLTARHSSEGHRFGLWSTELSAYVLTALHSGNVGIGTTTPTEKLEVAGNIRAQGGVAAMGIADLGIYN